jgi:hypothetical protein
LREVIDCQKGYRIHITAILSPQSPTRQQQAEEIEVRREQMDMNQNNHPAITYQIRFRGKLDGMWTGWFPGLTISCENEDPPITLLTAVVPDQARLRGILNKAWDLNLTVLSIIQVGEQP